MEELLLNMLKFLVLPLRMGTKMVLLNHLPLALFRDMRYEKYITLNYHIVVYAEYGSIVKDNLIMSL